MKYIIWKASITEYRVLNTVTGEMQILDRFTAVNCTFNVNVFKYERAKETSFANSGNPNDYFAWIECQAILPFNNEIAKQNVFYNPFKASTFRDRVTEQTINKANFIEINLNTLAYV
jgi:hypothetical protein